MVTYRTTHFQHATDLLHKKGYLSQLEIIQVDFATFYQACSDSLTWQQANRIYQEARQYADYLHAQQRKIVAHANPQLQQLTHLALSPLANASGYEQWFGRHAGAYVNTCSVASMFSPAAYLVELYREGKKLHHADSPQHLDRRRPDLQALTLNQSNMDAQISTLTLASDILSSAINETTPDTQLATQLYPFDLPYHAPFTSLTSLLNLQGSSFTALAGQLRASMADTAVAKETHSAFANHLSPGLLLALTTAVPKEATALQNTLQQHIGTADAGNLTNVTLLCQRTGIHRDKLNALLSLDKWTESCYSKITQFTTEPIAISPRQFGSRYLNQSQQEQNSFLCISSETLLRESSTLSAPDAEFHLLPTGQHNQLGFCYKLTAKQEATGPVNIKVMLNGTLVEQRIINNLYDHWLTFSIALNGARTGKITIIGTQIINTQTTGTQITETQGSTPITESEIVYTKVLKPVTAEYLIRLSQLIRYSNATGLSPATLDSLIMLSSSDPSAPAITQATLKLSGHTRHYMAHYGLSEDQAVVLAGGNISPFALQGSVSLFDQLFNTPPLNGQPLTLNDEEGSLDLRPEKNQHLLERAVLKRAFGCNDAELLLLATLANRDRKPEKKYLLRRNLSTLSLLYRAALLARVLQLSLTELETLLQSLGWADSNHDLSHMSTDTLAESLARLEQWLQWLQTHKLSVAIFNAMVTQHYPTTMTQEISNFLYQLYYAGKSSAKKSRKELLAPHIASTFGLADKESGRLLQEWLEQIAKEQKLTVTTLEIYWQKIESYCKPNQPDTSQAEALAAFTQALGQLALVIKTWQYSASELSLLINKPAMLPASTANKLSLTADTLLRLSQFKALQQAVGEGKAELMGKLNSPGLLDSTTLARLLNQPEAEVKLAVTALKDGNANKLTAVQGAQIITWLQAAKTLGVSVAYVQQLLTAKLAQDFNSWKNLANNLQAGVPNPHKNTLEQAQAEQLSSALSAYFLSNKAPALPTSCRPEDRDGLFQYLLIDNQVSSQIQSSRIAEAISSLQLYIHRCRQGLEPEVNQALLSTDFFNHWDRYNKRYSTWASARQLSWYPENYLDPTLRYNQTELQQQLHIEISQNQLDKESVEQAYRNYLNGFEEVANLKVLCGYQDSTALDSGTSYFTGRSTSQPYRYYWRTLDHTANDQAGGFIASAWSPWQEIECPINPVNDEVRPIILNHRLYIGWIEQRIAAEAAKDKTEVSKYSLQLSYHKINGSWSPAMRFPLEIPAELFVEQSKPKFNLYLSYYPGLDALLFILYDPNNFSATDQTKNKKLCGIIYSTMEEILITNETNWKLIYALLSNNLNTAQQKNQLIRRIHTKYPVKITAHVNLQADPEWLSLDKIEIVDSKVDESSTPPMLSYTAQATLQTKNKNRPEELENKIAIALQNDITLISSRATYSDENNIPAVTVTLELQRTKIVNKSDFLIFNRVTQSYLDHDQVTLEQGLDSSWIFSFTEHNPKSHQDSISYDITAVPDACRLPYLSIALSITPYYTIGQLNCGWQGAGAVPTPTRSTLPVLGSSQISQDFSIPIQADGHLTTTAVFSISTDHPENITLFKKSITIDVTRVETNPKEYYQIVEGAKKVRYLEASTHPRRTRLNTLFANELIQRSHAGLERVLSWETQQLKEPPLGKGTYIKLTFKPYNATLQGSDRAFELYQCKVYSDSDQHCIHRDLLEFSPKAITLFLPSVTASANTNALYLIAKYQTGATKEICFKWEEAKEWYLDSSYNGGLFSGLERAEVCKHYGEPMDFNGANGLYFWELFYYTPMLVTEKLLQAQNFTEAEHWLKYLFNPAGYPEDAEEGDSHPDRIWNVRPLVEDIDWNPIFTTYDDPDKIAQYDPIHYKVATYMKLLDLMITRGDMAYRQQQRDRLTEAKMWYVAALTLLGQQPDLPISHEWSEPTLLAAASQSDQQQNLLAMAQLMAGASPTSVATENNRSHLAHSLFLPAENEKLKGYWQTLHQRLYNLRHNLSINGQPLALPLYASISDPKAWHQATSTAAGTGHAAALPTVTIALQRFIVMLGSARELVSQLIQYGNALALALERKDSEALNRLMQTQVQELMLLSIQMQEQTLEQLQSEQRALNAALAGAQNRYNSYQTLLTEGISRVEQQAINERIAAGSMTAAANASRIAAALLDLAPNTFGMAVGGSRWGAVPSAIAFGLDATAASLVTAAEARATSEQYRRRTQEWDIQHNAAEYEIQQIMAQQTSLDIQIKAAQLQKNQLQTQQAQGQAQLMLLKSKFSNQTLYSWIQGRLSALFYQFYDLAVARCLQAQLGYQWETGKSSTFIQPGCWDNNHAGLLCGETLMLNLAQMEADWLQCDQRALEVSRTLSLAQAMGTDLSHSSFNAKVQEVLKTATTYGTVHTLALKDNQFTVTLNLSKLGLAEDYPTSLGNVRRIKQISVSLPALLGPYQSIQAVLAYSGQGRGIHQSCRQAALSHGINDSGLFQLDFNDSRYLPFEGLPIAGEDNKSCLTLSFPNARGKQLTLLNSLNDIVLHIRYTIRNPPNVV